MKLLRLIGMWSVLFYIRWWAWVALFLGKPTTIGIAGSVGKSSTKQVLLAMLQEVAQPRATYGNSETGVPLGILDIELGDSTIGAWLKALAKVPFKVLNLRSTSHLIIEMATDEPYPPKNMDYLLSIVRPQYSLLLNTFAIHTLQFGKTLEEIPAEELERWSVERKQNYVIERLAEEDAKIITSNHGTVGVYNADNALVGQQILRYLSEEPLTDIHSFGQQPDNQVSYTSYTVSPSGSQFGLRMGTETYTISVSKYLLPLEYREVLAAALLSGSLLGFNPSGLVASLDKHLHLPKSRSSLFKGIKNSIIIDSSYNASGAAVAAMVQMLAELKRQTNRPTVVILGDMREIGMAEAAEHTKVAQALSQMADRVYLVGSLTQKYVQPWLQEHAPQLVVEWFANYDLLNQSIQTSLPDQALILVKGSQNTIFLEETVKVLLADSQDVNRLCRQEDYWLKRKQQWLKGQG